MAFSATTEWDVQTGGSDAAGGGFDTASSGTDRSQGSVFQAYTDIVIDAPTNTKITSAAHPFDSTSPGNIINITAGTGFSVQRIQIVSVAAGVATCDKAVGTTSSTGGTGNLGGSLLTVGAASVLMVNGNTTHIKAGTYTITTTIAVTTLNVSGSFIGYQTTHRDGGTKPLITSSTNSVNLFTHGAGAGVIIYNNLKLTSTAGTRGSGIVQVGGGVFSTVRLIGTLIDGCQTGIQGDNGTFNAIQTAQVINSEIKNCISHGVFTWGYVWAVGSYIHGNGGDGMRVTGNFGGQNLLLRSIVTANGGKGFNGTSTFASMSIQIMECTFAGNTSSGLSIASGFYVGQENSFLNNILYGNGAYGFEANASATNDAFRFVAILANAYGANSTAPFHNFAAGVGDVAITADPFTNSAAGDYSLNSTVGGGPVCKGAGFPGVFPGATSTGVLDIGAVDSGTGGGGGSVTYVLSPNVTRYLTEEN